MATKTINTRIGLKYDTLANWTTVANTFVPLKGEVIFYEIPTTDPNVDVNVPNLSKPQTPPAILFKVGDGTTVLGQLPWGSAIAADVYAWAKQQSLLGGTSTTTEGVTTWTWSNDQAYAQEQAEVRAFVKEETSNIKIKVAPVETPSGQTGDHWYQTYVSQDGGTTWEATGDPFQVQIDAYTAGEGLNLVNNQFSVKTKQNGYIENTSHQDTSDPENPVTVDDGIDVVASEVTYTPAVPATPATYYTAEDVAQWYEANPEAAEGSCPFAEGDVKSDAIPGTPASLTATTGVLTDGAVSPIKSYVDAKLADAGTAGAVTVEKLGTASEGYASTYVVKQGGVQVGAAIDIPKDFLVKSATLSTVETAGQPYAGAVVGEKYIDFTVNTTDNSETATHIYLPVKDLVDVYTGGSTNYAVTTVDNNRVITTEIQTASVATAHGVQYSFTSYSAQTGGTQYGTGTVEVIGSTDTTTTVKVLTNTVDGWAGRTFTVNAVEPFESNTRYQLIENNTELPVWVQITGKTDSTDGIAVASDVKQYVDSQIAVATPNIEAGDGIQIATAENVKTVSVKLDETNSSIANNAGSGLVASTDGLRIDDSLTWVLKCGSSTENIN